MINTSIEKAACNIVVMYCKILIVESEIIVPVFSETTWGYQKFQYPTRVVIDMNVL